MEVKYLIDTDILIYYFNGLIKSNKIDVVLINSFNISIVTKIEFLSWDKLYSDKILFEKAKEFISNANVFDLNSIVCDMTIELRQKHKIKVPDAIIASTAKVYDFKVLTNNLKHFEKVDVKTIDVKKAIMDILSRLKACYLIIHQFLTFPAFTPK